MSRKEKKDLQTFGAFLAAAGTVLMFLGEL
jgi:hypothetical protein